MRQSRCGEMVSSLGQFHLLTFKMLEKKKPANERELTGSLRADKVEGTIRKYSGHLPLMSTVARGNGVPTYQQDMALASPRGAVDEPEF